MKVLFIKMALVILLFSSLTTIYMEKNTKKVVIENHVENSLIYTKILSYNVYEEEIVYQDLTLSKLEDKLNNVLSSTLKDYGRTIAESSLEQEVDPLVATSIILVETGCTYNCSYLVKHCNNVGGMKGKGCGAYAKFSNLEEGINAFITNLSKNYYKKGLNTPELINKKYASNPSWYKNVYHYMNLIKAS
ncbi:MAG: glucosaminidase domain-containing protein [Ruminococcus sp.]|nr:glucosaminidase domain-containing protein [Ruminococcus sp.]